LGDPESFMQSQARVAIVGGGIMGVGLLYHLALEGWTDVVLLEKGELTSGSTWHAAGQCPHFTSSLNAAKLHVYGTQLYSSLEAKTGTPVSWHTTGGLRLAATEEEVNWFNQVMGVAKLAGYEAHIIGPNEIPRYHPFLDVSGVKAAFLTVTDGHVAPADATMAMAAGGRALGATIERRMRVTNIRALESGEWLVETDQGELRCEHVVNAAGSYCNEVASWTGHRAPIANMLHHYVVTEPVGQLAGYKQELPVVRDPWSHAYLRREGDGILIGPYETSGAHECWRTGVPAWDFESELVTPELDRLMPQLERAAERFPLFGEAGIRSVVSGAIPHTPDGAPLSGPAPGARNYWMHCGASLGICQGAGISQFLAQWMVHGQPEINAREFDPRRFGDWTTPEVTRDVGIADYQRMYYCYKPAEQHKEGRDLRTSSLHDTLKARGAQFSQVFGWERARWYDPSGQGEQFSFKRSNWWDRVRNECLAVRERVGLMDLSTFAKFEVTGPDAFGFLQRVCANAVPKTDGRVMLGHMLNANGFIDSEITVTRLAADRFYVVSSAAAQVHDLDQLRGRIAAGERVEIADVTDAFGVLVLAGPRARKVLAACTDVDLGNATFRWLTGKEITVAGVTLRALRVNYVGELGWELHTPMAEMPKVFEAVMQAGKAHGIALFGTYAMNSLRMEKAYHAWGTELTNEVTLIAADMERFVDFKKDFIGKPGTVRDKQEGPASKLVYLSVEAVDNDCYGNEPVYHDGRIVGLTTGGAYGHAVGTSLAFAYVEPGVSAPGTRFELEMMGRHCPATVLAAPAWDPENARLKA
jgi:dimethylglycine dehydrogenase